MLVQVHGAYTILIYNERFVALADLGEEALEQIFEPETIHAAQAPGTP